jgi:hypothetical protein
LWGVKIDLTEKGYFHVVKLRSFDAGQEVLQIFADSSEIEITKREDDFPEQGKTGI